MATRYFKADLNGKMHYRTTISRVYVALCEGRDGLGWVSRMDLIPSGAPRAAAQEITKEEYNAARRQKAQGRPVDEKLRAARRGVAKAQYSQRRAGKIMLSWSLVQLGYSEAEIRAEGLFPYAGMSEALFVQAQRDQANAYKRIVKYRKLIAELERAAA